MTNNDNFKWLTSDIDNTLVLKVLYKNKDELKEYGLFNVIDVLETTGDMLEVETANIDDLTSLLTLGIVRFVNIEDNSDILDIPFRNLYLLYKNGNILGKSYESKFISFKEIEAFSIIDGTIENDFLVVSTVINDVSEDLEEVMRIANSYKDYGMQEKFDALTKITMINHRRLVNDRKDKILK